MHVTYLHIYSYELLILFLVFLYIVVDVYSYFISSTVILSSINLLCLLSTTCFGTNTTLIHLFSYCRSYYEFSLLAFYSFGKFLLEIG